MEYEAVCSIRITSDFEEYRDFILKLLDEKGIAYIVHMPYIYPDKAKYGRDITIIRPKEEKNDQN